MMLVMSTQMTLDLPGIGPPIKFVYIGTRGSFIKIGSSMNPNRRAKELGLRLLHIEPGGLVREHELHQQFWRARLDREWFLPSPDLLDYITRRDERPAA
jgi:hypothetical protein